MEDQSSADTDSSATNRDELLATLQSVYETVERLPKRGDLTETRFTMHDYISAFGSWEAAREAAGIDKQELLLAEFVRVSEQLGAPPTVPEMGEHGEYSPSMYYGVFDGWEEVKQAARKLDSAESGDRQETPESHKHDATRSDNTDVENDLRDQLRYKHRRQRFETGS